MPAEIVTTDDLREFKIELLREFKRMLKEHHGEPSKRWLKSYEVKELMGISSGKLQQMRVNGSLPFSKIGGMIFYDYEDIRKMLEENQTKNHSSFSSFR
ncbi:helix-turn-helix domain-containing protein [Sunxiuqinia elliptica]|uniref:Helix-turn-helix protein n=1 Tax=Sunxiuqinia elliptica TaxID=655355 RepID=A0A4R6HBM6_9BACT|nr:helix-turn-helix domain-containing protein [Sunxiuqinia elliptica]TDO05368.1 helix-turn-helix protein [Sunxiuqinia elliptica]TDO64915.1 helix-turn-helix protein [Sunxiuqinia elliptica]